MKKSAKCYRNLLQSMNLSRVSHILLLLYLCFLDAINAISVSINCGSAATCTARSGREWLGDVAPRPSSSSSSLLLMKGSSTVSTLIHGLLSDDDPIPYTNARLSRSPFSYTFRLDPGQNILLRLHFNPKTYKGFRSCEDWFTVDAGPFTLLTNFSAALTAHHLGLTSFVKEYYLYIEENHQLFDLVFSPMATSSDQSLHTYAFVNGIEIMSLPGSPYVDNTTALEIIHLQRLNLRQDSVHKFDMWETGPKQKVKNITWRESVDVGFKYLVRLYFSQLRLKMAGDVVLKVCINENMVDDTNIRLVGERDDEDIFPMYKDYMVMMKGRKREGKRELLIRLDSNVELIHGNGPLQGFEIMKLSNPDNSLASPNPLSLLPGSSHGKLQTLHQILGTKNMVASAVITILALANIFIHMLCHVWEATGTEEEKNIWLSEKVLRLCRRFSLDEIQAATKSFSGAYVIGNGGFGKVYKGFIDSGQECVAIKRLKSNSKQGESEFLTEIETLIELRHVNLVSLIGYCNELKEMILVYEYMAHGTLADHLYKLARKGDKSPSLSWKQRLTICIEAARGLDYLHSGQLLIHRDIKASNILLDENFSAKISDFGLAIHLNRSELEGHVSTKIKGTLGYFDPNYFSTGKLTRKSDVYAFGVVLLEVVSGRQAVNRMVPEDEQILTKWAQKHINEGRVYEIVDSNMSGEITEDSLKAFVELAQRCLNDEPNKRPTMAQVVVHLELAVEQQESSNSPQIPNANDIHPSEQENPMACNVEDINLQDYNHMSPSGIAIVDETSILSSAGKVKTSSIDVQVSPEPASVKKDGKKSRSVWSWDTFWNKIKPSSKIKSGSVVVEEKQGVSMVNMDVQALSFHELCAITANFSPKYVIGDGAYGMVYRGVLKSGVAIAIKRTEINNKLSDQEFLAQVALISKLKHGNMVELLGYHVGDGHKFLAYEFATHGSLQDTLHSRSKKVLSWVQRVQISIEAAKGLEHIHQNAEIHLDIKSSNILLFDDYEVAKIADFGLSNRDADVTERLSSTLLVGTFGCDAPEYLMTGRLSWRSDVYSFGVILLELLTGRKPFDHNLPTNEKSLVTWAKPMLVNKYKVKRVVDYRLEGNYSSKGVTKMAELASLCVQNDAKSRPKMSVVVKTLQSLLEV